MVPHLEFMPTKLPSLEVVKGIILCHGSAHMTLFYLVDWALLQRMVLPTFREEYTKCEIFYYLFLLFPQDAYFQGDGSHHFFLEIFEDIAYFCLGGSSIR